MNQMYYQNDILMPVVCGIYQKKSTNMYSMTFCSLYEWLKLSGYGVIYSRGRHGAPPATAANCLLRLMPFVSQGPN